MALIVGICRSLHGFFSCPFVSFVVKKRSFLGKILSYWLDNCRWNITLLRLSILPDGVMVAQLILVQFVLVRIQVGQPILKSLSARNLQRGFFFSRKGAALPLSKERFARLSDIDSDDDERNSWDSAPLPDDVVKFSFVVSGAGAHLRLQGFHG